MPALGSSAYVSLETVTNLMRAIVNDMIYSQAGELLTDTANVMFPLLNDSLEWFQNECGNHGVDTFTKETYLPDVLVVAVNDPGVQTSITDAGYYDGVTNHSAPQLPTDLYEPLYMWERQTGSTEQWIPMRRIDGGLPSIVQSSRISIWEWREDGIYMPGATQEEDLRLRYKGTLAMFVTSSDTLYFRGGVGPIAYKTVSTYLSSRNPDAAEAAGAEAMLRVGQIFSREARAKQYEDITRISYGSQRRGRQFRPPQNP